MAVRSQAGRPGARVRAHSAAVFEVHERMLGAFRASGRHVEVSSGRGVHVIEAGDGVPVVFLHGSSTSSLSLLPVLERLEVCGRSPWTGRGSGSASPLRCRVRVSVKPLSSSSTRSSRSWSWTRSRWPATRWVGPGPSGMRSRTLKAAPARAPRFGAAPARDPTSAPLRVMATPVVGDLLTRDETDSEDARSADVVAGREGHDRPLPGSDRGARGGGQGPACLGGQPR